MGNNNMDKRELLIHLNVARAGLSRALLGISSAEFEAAIMAGDWTPHDVVAHIAAWERWTCDAVRVMRAGRPVQVGLIEDDDAFNARAAAQRRDWPLKQLLDEFTVARRQLIVSVAGASAEQLTREHIIGTEPYTIAGLVKSIIDHDAEHASQITEWKKSRPDAVGSKLILQAALETNRSALLALLDTVPADARETLAVEGTWTAKDICGHIADCDELFTEAIFAVERNERITWQPGDYGEGWNQAHAQERRDHTWARMWKDFIDRRGTIVTELQERVLEPDLARTLPDPWGGEMTFYRWLSIPCEHDSMHAASLLAWFQGQAASS
jgi:uncharacterized damage-inducible protein DinB